MGFESKVRQRPRPLLLSHDRVLLHHAHTIDSNQSDLSLLALGL
jgi:hypothetical protein